MQAKTLILLTLATFALAAPKVEQSEDKPKDKRSLRGSGYGYGHGDGISTTFAAPGNSHDWHATFTASTGHSAAAATFVGSALGHATFSEPSVDLIASASPYVSHGVHTNTIVTRHVPVAVPQPIAVPVEKHIPYPVVQKVAVPVDRPFPVAVPKPYPVEVIRTVRVPIDRPVPVPVHVPVVKHVPAPYPVNIRVPVHVPIHVPVIKRVPYAVHSKPIVVERFSSNDWNAW